MNPEYLQVAPLLSTWSFPIPPCPSEGCLAPGCLDCCSRPSHQPSPLYFSQGQLEEAEILFSFSGLSVLLVFFLLSLLLLSPFFLKINLLWLKRKQTENPGDWFLPIYPRHQLGASSDKACFPLQGPTSETSQALDLNSFYSLRSSKHFRNMSSFGVHSDLDSKCPRILPAHRCLRQRAFLLRPFCLPRVREMETQSPS